MDKGKNKKKRWKVIIWGLVAAVILYTVWANVAILNSAGPFIIGDKDARNTGAQCILVLGAKIEGDKPSQILKNRLDCGISLYRQGCAQKVLLTGDGGAKGEDEVDVMKKYFEDAGVSAQDIFLDREGYDTYDSMYRAKTVYGIGRVLIVTQTYHLTRSIYIARSLGMQAYGVSAQPDENLQFLRDIREVAARNKDFISSYFKPEVPMDGSPVSIGGDGRITQQAAPSSAAKK